jgi:hypothetical protein
MKRGSSNKDFFYDKKGQITLFIIIAIIIVAIALLIYFFFPQIFSTLGTTEQNPNAFIQSCIEDEIKSNVETLSAQGGILEPAPYILYNNEKIQYLCYQEAYYETCVVQKPLLEKQIEAELKKGIENKVKTCFNELKTSFENRGYNVNIKEGGISTDLLPEKIVSTFNYSVVLTKTETQKYESFNVVLNNNLYELISIANSIIDWESTYGDADTSLYMDIYHNLKIEKKKPEYGTTIYILTDRDSGVVFQFASRSLVVPPGYGTGVI